MKNRKISVRLLVGCFVVSSCLVTSCKNDSQSNVTKNEITFKKEGKLTLFRSKDSVIQTLDIEIADNDYERETGLMYRHSMQEKQGMLFVFKESKPRYFYMKNTNIPLDLIYLDDKYKIVSFQKNAKPNDETTLPSHANAKYVLEINAGLADQWTLKVGDSISY
ncbi:MAG: DUF192 domain-containing protein [Mangrovimonas sp.]|nr:DUF192 domain-containing protein [Mangrovimonas sp.]